MKKALKTVVFYLALFFIFLLFGTLFYLSYLNIVNFSAGGVFSFFKKELFFKAFFYVGICACVVMCPLLTIYKIRHKGGPAQLITYILLSAVTWVLLFPLFLEQANRAGYSDLVSGEKVASANYFRASGNKIYYFNQDLIQDGEAVTSLVITPENLNAIQVKEIKGDADFVLFKDAEPYNDIFTKKVFEKKSVLNLVNFRGIVDSASETKTKGWNFWLFYLSFGIALACVYGVSNFFDWKLLNTVGVLFSAFLIIVCNSMYSSVYVDGLRAWFAGKSLFIKLSNVMDNPPLVLFNLLISLLYITVGIVIYFVKKNRVEE